jgi:replicative superfamily II helicase
MIESSLHKNLIEHVNSEIALHTIHDVGSALEWLRSTYLYVRASLNPRYYGVADNESPDKVRLARGRLTPSQPPDRSQRFGELILQSVRSLAESGIISDDTVGGQGLRCTSLGEIMSRFYVSHATFVAFNELKPNASCRDVVRLLPDCWRVAVISSAMRSFKPSHRPRNLRA